MRISLRRASQKINQPPGTAVYVGKGEPDPTVVSVIDYDAERHEARALERAEDAFPFKETPTVTWLDIAGLRDVDAIESIARRYDVHPLVIEDILNTTQRPKIEIFDNYIFVVLRMLRYDEAKESFVNEQVCLILGPRFVITFSERPNTVLDGLRKRIRDQEGRVRKAGADYLAYALIDVICDQFFTVMERIGESIEGVEAEVMDRPTQKLVQRIHSLKRELISLRKASWPLREALSALMREEHELIQPATLPYLRDLYDHTIQVIDMVETSRDMLSGLLDIYLSSVSNRMNEVMKVLTIIATIFIPLTFVAGIYGMNFEFMPELHWRWAYPAALGVMLAVVLVMLAYFKRKRWL